MKWFDRKFRSTGLDELWEGAGGEYLPLSRHPGDWSTLADTQAASSGAQPVAVTLVTSLKHPNIFDTTSEIHAPVLDLDIEHEYWPSSRPGHASLMLNVDLPAELHAELLDVLERCGILESGFVASAKAKGYAAVRTPWTKKLVKP